MNKWILLLLLLPVAYSQNCGNYIGGLCQGYDSAICTTSVITGCGSFPRCMYSGTISGFYCKNSCYDTGNTASCGGTQKCLCLMQKPCSLCTGQGMDLNACSQNGCGPYDQTPPAVTITSPTTAASYATSVSPISLAGTATDDNVVAYVRYANSRNSGAVGGSGQAVGTGTWAADYINLEPGTNVITVTATDGYGRIGTDTVTVTYNKPSVASYPIVSLSESATSYTVSISDPDALNVQYAWAPIPTVYFLVPFASNSNPALSAKEQQRLAYLGNNIVSYWDIMTQNKHPLKFVFAEPYSVPDYSTGQQDQFQYLTRSINSMGFTPQEPYILVFLYPEPYWTQSYTNIWNTKDKLAEVYIANFNDAAYSDSDEVVLNIVLHELAHDFVHLPNNVNLPGSPKLFWMGHPAGFYGVAESCDEGTMFYDCKPYGASESPTGQEGYYEAYSILSLIRTGILRQNLDGRYPELSPVEQMALGTLSKYEDSPYLYYSGYLTGSGSQRTFVPVSILNYGYSSRWITDYSSVERRPSGYWDIRFDSTKTSLGNTRTFSLAKSAQQGRALIVYAEDAQNPGYFKVFGNNAHSQAVYFESVPPSAVSNLHASASGRSVTLTWTAATDNVGIRGYEVQRNNQVMTEVQFNSYVDSYAPLGTTTYTVVPIDLAGNRGPAKSTTVIIAAHPADTNEDGCVSIAELASYIGLWKITPGGSMGDILSAINAWRGGC